MTTSIDSAGFRSNDLLHVRDDDRRWLVSRIKQAGCVQQRPVTLSSGRQSDYYVNLRLLTLGPYLYGVTRTISRYITDVGEPITSVAGVLSAAAPLVAGCVALAGIPLRGLLIRREAKQHGTRDLIEGPTGDRDIAFLLDDVATSGDSLVHGVRCLVDAGIRVAGALVLLDRTGEAGPRLAQFDVPFHTILTPQDLDIADSPPRRVGDNALPQPRRVRRKAYQIYVGEGRVDIHDLAVDREALVDLLRSLDPPPSGDELDGLRDDCAPLPPAIKRAVSEAITEARTVGDGGLSPRKIDDNALPKPSRVRREAYTIYVGEGSIDIDDLPADREALVGLLRSLDPPLSDGELGMLWYGCGPLPFAIREAIFAAIDEARAEGKRARHDEERRRQIVASQRQDLDRAR